MFNSCSTPWINQRLVEITPVVVEKIVENVKKFQKDNMWKKVEGGCVSFVVESRNYPNKSSNYPNKSSNYPNKSSNYPNKSSNYPNKSSNWNPSCNLDCKENVLS